MAVSINSNDKLRSHGHTQYGKTRVPSNTAYQNHMLSVFSLKAILATPKSITSTRATQHEHCVGIPTQSNNPKGWPYVSIWLVAKMGWMHQGLTDNTWEERSAALGRSCHAGLRLVGIRSLPSGKNPKGSISRTWL